MDREVPQALSLVGEEASTRETRQPDYLTRREWNRGQLCLQGSTAVEDVDEDIEGRPDVFLDLTPWRECDDVRIEITLLRLELPHRT